VKNSKVESGYMSVARREKTTRKNPDAIPKFDGSEYAEVIAIRIVDEDHHFVMDIELDMADYARATTGMVVSCRMIKKEE